MRLRLRESSEADYQVARSNDQWWEHQARTLATAGLIAFLHPNTILDLGCGDGSLVFTAHKLSPIEWVDFCDISTPSIEMVMGKADAAHLSAGAAVMDVEERLDHALANTQYYDLILLTEILEHLPDPVTILRKAFEVGHLVLASSPIIELPRGDPNPEHLWAFDNDGYLEMFAQSHWLPKICQNLMFHDGYYNFQIWVGGHG